ncbi:MSEP-CTERM sorting domain-containing protein [Hymenobacter sp. DH14]|uniref:MSEP-CTERM sorting domain-containing protein n=1 Tax=Hymenobacter cyanobacteriorum TaxID=2926463 RepID=A0A9X1VJ76_9BACT|nr:MSEP-CTERM sorting domain-containing protein [Hymenobacter cyanobacteriorum]MCI1189168.1 MSEP-CTERM sorting domain-containing protein [Hymenobacter cyanobacteriorum]
MQSLRSPKWIFLASTAPLLVYLLVCAGEFSVIRTLLPAASVGEWQAFGAALALLGLGGAGYAAWQLARRQPVAAWYSGAVLLAFSLWLCLLTTHGEALLPRSVPAWMVPTNPILMAWTFLMPTLAHAMLALVARFTPDDRPHQVAPNILFAVVVPMGWALVFEVLTWLGRLLRGTSPEVYTGPSRTETVGTVIIVASLVVGTLSFFFFLTRALFISSRRRERSWADGGLVWKLVVTIVLPLLGLGLNNGLFFGQGFHEAGGIFGNFSSPWFYVLTIVNGALLCLPDSEQPGLRLAQLLGRSALFGFTFYFFLVFLPFLPLAIPAIILIGTGFLLLAPLLLFVVHVRQLADDVAALRTVYRPRLVTAALLAGLAVLPLYFTGSFWHRRQVLHEALAYVYTPDYTQPPRVDAEALAATLAQVRLNKDRNFDLFFGSQQPYLSTYFNWLVLDNLMLSEHKINELELIFTGDVAANRSYLWANLNGPPPPPPPAPGTSPTTRRFSGANLDGFDDPAPDPGAPQLRNAAVRSRYDARQQAWVSWVDLEVANTNPGFQNREYSTAIWLPEGCWVGDYTLTIGNRQEHGILAEKKAATWVFAQILSENSSRDPGLLAYRGPHEIAVRVYPVSAAEARHTSIQFLHKEPIALTVDGRTLALGDSADAALVTAPITVPGSGVAYVSGVAKQQLPLVQRRPYYHFLLDVSASQADPANAFRERLAGQLARPLPNGAPARFSLVNAATTPVPAGNDWAAAVGKTGTGGFYLGGAIRRVLFEAQEHPGATYPVLVVVTDDFNNAVLDADFENFQSAYPESDVFYVLGADGQLVPHSLRHAARQPLSSASPAGLPAPGASTPVRAWPDAAHPRVYLPATPEPAVVVTGRPTVPTAEAPAPSRWLAGLLLRGYGQWQSFHPEITDRERVPFIQASFRAGILTPFTSFLALENDAQKAALHRKQEQTLAANASLDTVENDQVQPTATPIDSGALLLLAAGLLLAGWHLRRMRTAAHRLQA